MNDIPIPDDLLASANEIETTQNDYVLTEHECVALALFFGTPHKRAPAVSDFRNSLCRIQQRKEMTLHHALCYYMKYCMWWDKTYERKHENPAG